MNENKSELFPNFKNIQIKCNLTQKGNIEEDLSLKEENKESSLELIEIPENYHSLQLDSFNERNLTNSSQINQTDKTKLKWIDEIYSKNLFYKYSHELKTENK